MGDLSCLIKQKKKKKANAQNTGVEKTSCVWMDHHNLGRSQFFHQFF